MKLEDGQLTFDITVDGEEIPWTVDLITAKLKAEELEDRHNLKVKAERTIPTEAFLSDLARAYDRLGAKGCTPTGAKTVWIVVARQFLRLSQSNAYQVEELLKERNPWPTRLLAGLSMVIVGVFVGYLLK